MIEIKNITKSFGSNQVLKGVSLTLQKGKVYGIVGQNGAGKTTLFRCITGLESFNGDIIRSEIELSTSLGYLATNPFLFEKITGKEYLQLVCNARFIKIENFEDQNIFDLPLNQYASTYSTGMKKKLALTGCLLQKNKVFVLDEPFNGTDFQSNIIITEIINKLKVLNKIVLISSHIYSTLADTCDEIHVLDNGRIVKSAMTEQFVELEMELKSLTQIKSIENLKL